jgi:chemotaxis protein CheD
MENLQRIFVNIGEYCIVKNNNTMLEIVGLGSCVAVILYDKINKIYGMAHIMLPSSGQAKGNVNLKKFADTGIKMMLEDMKKMGGKIFEAIIVGGACLFESQIQDPIMKIGERNVEAVKEVLKQENISIVKEDVGGNFGRTVSFDTSNCIVYVKSQKYGLKQL